MLSPYLFFSFLFSFSFSNPFFWFGREADDTVVHRVYADLMLSTYQLMYEDLYFFKKKLKKRLQGARQKIL
jgi:hypothetical protein